MIIYHNVAVFWIQFHCMA